MRICVAIGDIISIVSPWCCLYYRLPLSPAKKSCQRKSLGHADEVFNQLHLSYDTLSVSFNFTSCNEVEKWKMLKFGKQITTDTEKTGNGACGNNTFFKIGVAKTENFIRKLHNSLNLGTTITIPVIIII